MYTENCYCRSGGIEVNGLVFTTITRRLQENPVLEISKFVENHAQLEFQDSIRSLTQLVIENSNTIRVKVVEICGKEQDENDLMCPVIQASLNDIPMIQHDITVLSLKPIYHPGISIRRNTLGSESHCLILVVKNFLETTDV